MAQLFRARISLLTSPYILYHSRRLSTRFRWSIDDSNRKDPILVGFKGFVRQYSSDGLPDDVGDSVFRYTTLIRNALRSYGDGCESKRALDECELPLSEEFVLDVLRRLRSEWRTAYLFFDWGSSRKGYSHGSRVWNEMLDILGRAREINLMRKVFDEMSEPGDRSLVNDHTYAILFNRYASGHRLKDAIDLLYGRRKYGLEIDLAAFQMILFSFCRYKHVEEAEALVIQKQREFPLTIESQNIILNGWCLLGNYQKAERFWEDILASGNKPDLFTYGAFINVLSKTGKMSTALEFYKDTWEKGCHPDVVICNSIIGALCFNKRIQDALQIFKEMSDRGCKPNVSTYSTLIRFTCKHKRMVNIAYELLNEMEKEGIQPDSKTFAPFFSAAKNPKEISKLLNRMKEFRCEIDGYMYNFILSLYIHFDYPKGVGQVWAEMERSGFGPDQRSYTYCIHWHHRKGRLDEAMKLFTEMQSRGMTIETRTKLLIEDIETKLRGSDLKQPDQIPAEVAQS